MKARRLLVHNFRSIADADVEIRDHSLIVGPNNAGKSNLMAAIRVFYEKDIKYDRERDFPKFKTDDKESWIELEFEPDPEELLQLKDEYKMPTGRFRVRKYLESEEKDDEGKRREGIYAYVDGKLSGRRFYGARNVQQGKLGEVIYIPAISKLDDHTKLTGPSALRDLLSFVLRGVLSKSLSYKALVEAFSAFGQNLKVEQADDGISLQKLEGDVSKELEAWGLKFELEVNPLQPEDIVKSLIEHRIVDEALGGKLASTAYGQGFQRSLVYALIRLAALYRPSVPKASKKEFSPTLNWILFEEPEAFLHPAQIAVLDGNLRAYSAQPGQQVLICTHNSQFASRSMEELPSIIRLDRADVDSKVGQVKTDEVVALLAANQSCLEELKREGISIDPEDEQIAMESIKYSLWLNPLRAAAFFSDRVLLVEGPSEYAVINYLLSIGRLAVPRKGITVIDTLGKWNIHRFMNLFGALRVRHSVLYDLDGGKPKDMVLARMIKESRNAFSIAIDHFVEDLESYLGVPKPKRPDKKPQHLMWWLCQGKVEKDRLDAFVQKVQPLLEI